MLPIARRWISDAAEEPWPAFVDASLDRYAETANCIDPDRLELVEELDDEAMLVLTSVDPTNGSRRFRVYLRLYRAAGVTTVDICEIVRE